MHEDLFVQILKNIESSGMSSSRILSDPQVKTIPLAERVALFKKYAPRIHSLTKVDSGLWHDVAIGSVGAAIAAFPAVSIVGASAMAGADIRREYDKSGNLSLPTPSISMGDISIMTLGVGVAKPSISNAKTFLRDRGLVRKYFSSTEGKTSNENVVNVIART